jgi:hypothetical protein
MRMDRAVGGATTGALAALMMMIGAATDLDAKPVTVADLPAAERTPIEVLRTESATFRSVLEQRRERHESWFKFNPGHIDLCNVPLPVRTPGRN